MNSMIGWNPLEEISEMQNRLSHLFGRRAGTIGDRNLALPDWSPAVDITEDDTEILIKAELPEVKKEDVKVRVEDGLLRISGERRLEKEQKGKKYHRIERAYGSFERRFALPETCKLDELAADYKDGMLTLRLPKSKESAPKAIEVPVH
ncbi:MAG: Hsp20/alpha crystallin family protein [Verrucomicrobiaceae bacterium]|nr:MAG: Hsp20/alpha crystallin family protein [Verrucomicrobiaceae bacterium]